MDTERFDTIARSLAGRLSRRSALRQGGAGIVAGALAALRVQSGWSASRAQEVCTDPSRPGVGCACSMGTQDPCGDNTLLCCANDPNGPPGGPGTCAPSSVGCNPTGPPSSPCTSRGCRCNGGVQDNCDDGLSCCADNPGLPGGPGRCVRQDKCNLQGCTGEGCSCHSGTDGACDSGLICCADDASASGGPGRCEAEDICLTHQCQATTNPCPSSCSAGTFCQGCCSGYCGEDDHCGAAPCSGVGCECTAGVESSCSEGLVCCQSQMNAPNAPGGPGMCATQDGCGNASASVGAAQATPAS
jgi:hypothetical protein